MCARKGAQQGRQVQERVCQKVIGGVYRYRAQRIYIVQEGYIQPILHTYDIQAGRYRRAKRRRKNIQAACASTGTAQEEQEREQI